MPPPIADTFAAALVTVMTGTASPCCSPRADAKKAITEAIRQVSNQGENSPAKPLLATVPVSALIASGARRVPRSLSR